jgi:hypothetical protein
MSSGPRATVDDRPSATPADWLSSVDGSAVHGRGAPAQTSGDQANASLRHEAEGRLLSAPLRVLVCVLAVSLFGLAGRVLFDIALTLITEGRGGLEYMRGMLWEILLGVPIVLFISYHWLWRMGWTGVDRTAEREAEAFESRAILEALERHDRLLAEAQAGGEGESGPVSRPEGSGGERVDEAAAGRYESAARRYELAAQRHEAAVDARVKERGEA